MHLPRPFCAWLKAALLLCAQAAAAQTSFEVNAGDTEVKVRVLPADGDLLAVWLLDHMENRPTFESMLQDNNAAGVEVWQVDLLQEYFLPRSSENARTLPGDGVAALLAAHSRSTKTVVLVAYDRMPLPLLRGVRQWQSRHEGPSRLAGAVLFYPNLFGPPPMAGQDPVLDPVVRPSNIPVALFQPDRGTHRWRLKEVLEAFWAGGSPTIGLLVPGVRDWFFMHPPGHAPAEEMATAAVPGQPVRLSTLMDAFPKPSGPPPIDAADSASRAQVADGTW